MLFLYLACLILGGTLVLFSVGVASGFDLGDADGALGHDLEMSHDGVGDHGPLHAFAGFLSLRGAVFFVAFFGLTGTALSLLRLPSIATLASALGMGMVAGSLIQRAVGYLQRSESGMSEDLTELEGHPARVLVAVERPGRGKIAVTLEDHTVQLLARVADEANRSGFAPGERVVVVRIRDGIAEVSEEEILR